MLLSTQSVFTYEALDLLRARLKESDTLDDFFSSVDTLANDRSHLLDLPVSIEFSEKPNQANDGDSALVIFEAIGKIDPANATDPRLWSFLALVVLRDYLQERWPRTAGDEWKNAITERWLLNRNPSRRNLLRHGVSRLWWIANLTYDPAIARPLSSKTSDPYAYTRWVLENQNRVQSIFERKLGSNPVLMWVMIEILTSERRQLDGGKADIAQLSESDAVKWITKEVHLRSGYRHLEILDETEIKIEVIA